MDSKRRRLEPWASLRHSRAACLCAGPATQAELADWPITMAEALTMSGKPTDSEKALRSLNLFCSGISMYTDYSGVDCPREAVRLGLHGLSLVNKWNIKDFNVVFSRSCDNGCLQSRTLQHISSKFDHGQSCVFWDILDRLPEAARDRVEACLPPPEATTEETRCAYEDLAQWPEDNAAW